MPSSKCPFSPAADFLLLEPQREDDAIDIGGGKKIYLPESGKRPLSQGKVIDVGPDVTKGLYPIGTDVIFPLHSEERIQIDRDWFYLIRQEQVIAYRDEAAN